MQLRRRSERGSSLLWVLALGMLVGIASLVIPQLLKRSVTAAFDTERQFEAQLLAANVREVAKYLVLYEKVFYTGNDVSTFAAARDPLTIDADLRRVWSQTFMEMESANLELVRACGGYSMGATYLGTHRLAGSPVFCPFYFRTHMFSGLMAEQMLFEQWASVAPVVTRVNGQTGSYSLRLDFTRALAPSNARLLGLDTGQKILREGRVQEASATITFSTDSAGFRAIASERFLNITSRIVFHGQQGVRGPVHFVEDTETIMMTLSTPKEFALFMLYPNVPQDPVLQARDFAANVSLADPAGTKVFGRTYFNGDMDLGGGHIGAAIRRLPVFHDAVILSGTLRPAPGPKHLEELKQHFRKGLVTNYSAARFLYSGDCAIGEPAAPSSARTSIVNHSQFTCKLPTAYRPQVVDSCKFKDLISHYMESLNKTCWTGSLRIADSGIWYTYLGYQPTEKPSICPAHPIPGDDCVVGVGDNFDPAEPPPPPQIWRSAAGDAAQGTLVHGGFNEIFVDQAFGVISSPVRKLRVKAGANIYGLVLGGAIEVPVGPASFYSLAALRSSPGLPGLGTDDEISRINGEAASGYEGVSVPLLNMPVVYSSKEGIR